MDQELEERRVACRGSGFRGSLVLQEATVGQSYTGAAGWKADSRLCVSPRPDKALDRDDGCSLLSEATAALSSPLGCNERGNTQGRGA